MITNHPLASNCRPTSCPAVLTENLFMDNLDDYNFLLSEEGRQAIVNLHVDGILSYTADLAAEPVLLL